MLERKAFPRSKPHGLETWHCIASRAVVDVRKRDYFERRAYTFPRESFVVDGLLPGPAI